MGRGMNVTEWDRINGTEWRIQWRMEWNRAYRIGLE